ncbi:hypothetical protein HN873_004247, partial [Arachis hypogaea]
VKNGHDGFLAVQSGIAYLKRILHIFPNCSLIRNLVGYLSLSGKELNSCYAIWLQGPEFDNNEFRRWFRSILTQYKRAKPESILSWVSNGVVDSPAFAAYDKGYDVFLGNFRGLVSREHRNKNISSRQYWQYSINEHGTQDIPAMIEKIHEVKTAELKLSKPDIEEEANDGQNYRRFFCSSDKEYNDLATIFFNTQDDAIRNLFSVKTIHEYSSQSLLTFLVVGSSEESIASSVAQAVLSEREIEAIVGSLGAEWAEERVATVEILLKCMQEDGTCRNIIADKAQLSTFLESLVGATEGELFNIVKFLSELVN